MPMEWVEPELFLEHRGIEVWHTYDMCDGMDQLVNFYTTESSVDDPQHDEADAVIFDVRDLPLLPNMDSDDHDLIIRYAIDQRRLGLPASQYYHHKEGSGTENLKAEISHMCNLRERAERNGSGNKYRVAWCEDAKEYVTQVWTRDGDQEGWLCLHTLEGEVSNPEDFFEQTGEDFRGVKVIRLTGDN